MLIKNKGLFYSIIVFILIVCVCLLVFIKNIHDVGRYGDSLSLGDLPNDLRQTEVREFFDPSVENEDNKILVCGSPGEVANDKNKEFLFDADIGFSTTGWDVSRNRKYVWIMTALGASDQLRQRVAWALSQVS